MVNRTRTFAQVIGENVKKLRGENTLEELAAKGRFFGAGWSSGSISAIERGEFKATLDAIALLALSLDLLLQEEENGRGITIHDLLQSDTLILIGERPTATTETVLSFLSGGPALDIFDEAAEAGRHKEMEQKALNKISLWKGMDFPDSSMGFLLRFEQFEEVNPITETERRLAKGAKIKLEELRAWSFQLWDSTLEEERDKRAGLDATPQRKGRVSRELLSEITHKMKGVENGNN